MADFTSYGFIAGYHDLLWVDRDTDGNYTLALTDILGSTGPEGIRQVATKEVEMIRGDAYGNTDIDAVYKGGNVELEFVLQELNVTAVREFLAAFRETDTVAANTRYDNEVGIVGHTAANGSGTGFAGTLVAIPRAGTPAELAYGGTSSRMYMGFPIGEFPEFLDTRHSVMPVRFKVLPHDNSGTLVWWQWTTDNYPTS